MNSPAAKRAQANRRPRPFAGGTYERPARSPKRDRPRISATSNSTTFGGTDQGAPHGM